MRRNERAEFDTALSVCWFNARRGKHPPYILNVKVLYSPVILSAAKDLRTPVSDTGRSACRSQCCKILRPAASERQIQQAYSSSSFCRMT